MNEICLFIKVRTVNGARDTVCELWENHLKQRAAENKNQKIYYYCLDNTDPNVICIFEHYSNPDDLKANAEASWFHDYMKEVTPFLDGEPVVNMTTPVWIK